MPDKDRILRLLARERSHQGEDIELIASEVMPLGIVTLLYRSGPSRPPDIKQGLVTYRVATYNHEDRPVASGVARTEWVDV